MREAGSTKAHWETHWSGGGIHLDPNQKIINTVLSLGDPTGKKLLEVGAGRGADSVFLARMGADSYVLDFSPAALEKSRQIAELNGVEINLIEGDAYELPFDEGTFDLVFHQGFLEHFHDPEVLLEEQRRVIAPGGYLVVDVPQRYTLCTIKKKIKMRRGTWFAGWETEFSLRQLYRLVEDCGFKVEGFYAWGMAGSYGWGIRNALYGARRGMKKAGTAFSRNRAAGTSSEVAERQPDYRTNQLLCYLADNLGVVARKI